MRAVQVTSPCIVDPMWSSLSARAGLGRPHTQGTVRNSKFEVVVGAQERQIVPNAQLSE